MPRHQFDVDIMLGELRADDLDALLAFIKPRYGESMVWWGRLQEMIGDEQVRRLAIRRYNSPRGDSGGLPPPIRFKLDPRKANIRLMAAGYNSIRRAILDLEPASKELTAEGATARAWRLTLIKYANTLSMAVLVLADKEADRRLAGVKQAAAAMRN